VQGGDIDPERMAGISQKYGLLIHKADVEREHLPFPAASFGIVLFTEILEHLRLNPLFALREAHRVLEPGGRMILSTPNITMPARLRFLAGRAYQGDLVAQFEKLETIGHMGHARLYSCDEVRRFLEHTGFRVLRQTWRRESPPGKKAGLIRSVYPVKRHVAPFLYVVAGKA
jgi:SAM-dependent methyltransferase